MDEQSELSGRRFALPAASQFFQKAVTGAVAEYAELPKEFLAGYLEGMTDWVLDR